MGLDWRVFLFFFSLAVGRILSGDALLEPGPFVPCPWRSRDDQKGVVCRSICCQNTQPFFTTLLQSLTLRGGIQCLSKGPGPFLISLSRVFAHILHHTSSHLTFRTLHTTLGKVLNLHHYLTIWSWWWTGCNASPQKKRGYGTRPLLALLVPFAMHGFIP